MPAPPKTLPTSVDRSLPTAKAWWLKAAGALVALGMLLAAAWTLKRYAAMLSWQDLMAAVARQPDERIAWSLALTAVSFLALGIDDVVACRVVAPGRVPLRKALLAGAAGHAISNTLGFHALTGSAIRLRVYGRCGLDLADALRVISVSGLAVGLGFLSMVGLGLVLTPFHAGPWSMASVAWGIAVWLILALFVGWLAPRPRVLAWRAWRLPLPPAPAAAGLIILGAIESAAAIGALYVLLPLDAAPSFLWFAVAYVSAVLLGIVAQVPGGLGVFEAAMATAMSGRGGPDLLAALLLYRLLYNLLPFVLMGAAFGLSELRHAARARRAGAQLDEG